MKLIPFYFFECNEIKDDRKNFGCKGTDKKL